MKAIRTQSTSQFAAYGSLQSLSVHADPVQRPMLTMGMCESKLDRKWKEDCLVSWRMPLLCTPRCMCVVARGSSSLGRRQAKAVWYSGLLWLVVPVSDRGGLKQPNSAMCGINGCEPHQGYFKKANDHLLVFSTPEGWLLNNKQRNGEDMFLHRLTPHLVSVLNSSGQGQSCVFAQNQFE